MPPPTRGSSRQSVGAEIRLISTVFDMGVEGGRERGDAQAIARGERLGRAARVELERLAQSMREWGASVTTKIVWNASAHARHPVRSARLARGSGRGWRARPTTAAHPSDGYRLATHPARAVPAAAREGSRVRGLWDDRRRRRSAARACGAEWPRPCRAGGRPRVRARIRLDVARRERIRRARRRSSSRRRCR